MSEMPPQERDSGQDEVEGHRKSYGPEGRSAESPDLHVRGSEGRSAQDAEEEGPETEGHRLYSFESEKQSP